ncbi:oxidoreductase NAD-binding domain-containing protein [Lentithecium fluviatile CBS 122367]|uniref:NADH-cytochrome b5 reductase n=1 Tax=Lentithecium fluviatile CBS 122367 TaxID=1168545 RepID=A0A6G1J7W0_9PLEO|nr:oxidoreductase NAD-binding domain-containing protein [Lentithecium fluviatile CBS 122367]
MALSLIRARPVVSSVVLGGITIGLFTTVYGRNVHADSNAPRKVFGKGPAFVSLLLESSEVVNHNTKRLRFKLPNPDDVSGLTVTSAVLTMSWPKGRWTPVARPYTPTSAIDEPGALELMVKRYPDGKQSTHLHSLQPGDKLLFAAALRGYQWTPNAVPHVTLIAGGAGITPIYQLARGILSNPEDRTAVTVVYGANSDEDVLLQKEFEAWRKEFGDRFKVVCTVSRPEVGSVWRKGHVTKELLEEVGAGKKEGEMVFVCGPPPMEAGLLGTKKEKGILEQLGYRKEQIHQF